VLAKTSPTDFATTWIDPPTGGEGGTATQQVTTLTAANGEGTVDLARGFTIQSVEFSGATRLRLYRSAGGRSVDAGRPFTTAYMGGSTLLYDYLALGAELDQEKPLDGAWAAGESAIYYLAAGPVDIIITWVRTAV
jgi:hypothetical protein